MPIELRIAFLNLSTAGLKSTRDYLTTGELFTIPEIILIYIIR